MSQILDTLIVKLNATGLQKRDQQLYDFLRNLLRGTSEVDSKLSAVIAGSSSSGGGSSVTNINQQFMILEEGSGGEGDGIPIPGSQGIQGIQGIAGSSGVNTTIMISEDGIDGEMIAIPGSQGVQGSQGNPGITSLIMISEDGIDGESLPIPGPQGTAGITTNINTILAITEDGIDGETIAIPGSQGPQGVAGVTTLQNTIVAITEDGVDAETPCIPGPAGPVATMIDFTQDLGTNDSSGTFDITGLAGLTVGADVTIVQTAQPIASKGNATDEFEMDAIQLTGYVLNSTTIRVYWWAPSVVVGIYAFAFAVSPGGINLGSLTSFWTVIISSVDQSVSNTTLTNDNELFFTMLANKLYSFELQIIYSSAGGGVPDFKFNMAAPATLTGNYIALNFITTAEVATNISPAGSLNVSSSVGTALTPRLLTLRGWAYSTTGGSGSSGFQLQFAQNIADANAVTRLAGSALRYRKLSA